MKYWILTTEYPPFFGGGIATYARHTAQMLSANGHDVTVFIYDMSQSGNKVEQDGTIRVIRFVPLATGVNSFLGFDAAISYEYAHIVGEYIRSEGKPDILESQEYLGIAYYTQQFKWLGYDGFRDLDILVTCHAPSFVGLGYNHVPIYQLPYYWTGQMEKATIRAADILVSPSRYFVREAKTKMDWEGLDEKYIANPLPVDANEGVPEWQENYIACFGKLSPLKGSFQLLDYFKVMWDEGFNVPLYYIGSADQFYHPEGEMMKDIIRKKYGTYIEKNLLRLVGELDPVKAKEQLLKAHMVLVPSIFDNLPYVVLEAMSWGKVVLASRQGGQSEIIRDEENGFLFDHTIQDDFSKKLRQLLQLAPDDIRRIGANAKATIQQSYQPQKIYSEKLAVIREYLSSARKRRLFPFLEEGKPGYNPPGETGIKGLLSIVIPYYNMGDYIEECVRSVVNAEYQEKEIIIVDDGSTDEKSIQVLASLEEKYPVKVYRKRNEKLPITRNFGADRSSGEYLAFLDADDSVEKTYYSKAINVLELRNNVHFVGCWIKYFGTTKGNWPAFNPEPPYLLVHNMVNSSALVYRRKSFLAHGQNAPELIFGMEDWDSVISMVKNDCKGVVLPEALFNYRVRAGSMARSFTRVKQLHLYRVMGERHRQYINTYGSEVAQLLHANGSGLSFDNPTKESPGAGLSVRLPGFLKENLKNRMRKNKYLRRIVYSIYKQLK